MLLVTALALLILLATIGHRLLTLAKRVRGEVPGARLAARWVRNFLVLSLPPVVFLPALLGLATGSVGLEYVQQVAGRSFEWDDVVANQAKLVRSGKCAQNRNWALREPCKWHAPELKLRDDLDFRLAFAARRPSREGAVREE